MCLWYSESRGEERSAARHWYSHQLQSRWSSTTSPRAGPTLATGSTSPGVKSTPASGSTSLGVSSSPASGSTSPGVWSSPASDSISPGAASTSSCLSFLRFPFRFPARGSWHQETVLNSVATNAFQSPAAAQAVTYHYLCIKTEM